MEKSKIDVNEELITSLKTFVLRVLDGKSVSDKELEILPETLEILISLTTDPLHPLD